MGAKKKKAMEILLILYVCTSLIFPAMVLNKIIFAVIMLLWLFGCKRQIIEIWAPLFILIIFVYGLALTVFFRADFDLAIQFLLSTVILFMIYPIRDFEIDFKRVIRIGGVVLLTVDLLYIFHALGKFDFIMPINLSFISEIVDFIVPDALFKAIETYGETAVGYRGFFDGFNVMVHLGSIPFLFLPTCLFFDKFLAEKKVRHLLFVLFAYVAIVCSTSRALLIITALANVYTWWHRRRSQETKVALIGVLSVVVVIVFVGLSMNTSFFDVDEISNSQKLDHITSVFESMSARQFIMGNGLGSYFYSNSLSKYLAHTEITLLDYCRYFGVIPALFIYFQLLFPTISARHKNKGGDAFLYKVFMIGYLVMSLTNPVLFNSIGTLVILWYWNESLRARGEPL